MGKIIKPVIAIIVVLVAFHACIVDVDVEFQASVRLFEGCTGYCEASLGVGCDRKRSLDSCIGMCLGLLMGRCSVQAGQLLECDEKVGRTRECFGDVAVSSGCQDETIALASCLDAADAAVGDR